MGWFGDKNNDWVWPPKVGGEPIIVTPVDIKRIESDNEKLCYTSKDKKKMAFYDEFILDDNTKLICGTWKLYFAIMESGSQPGDTIKISHPGMGQYTVEIVKKKSDAPTARGKEDLDGYLAGVTAKHGPKTPTDPAAKEVADIFGGKEVDKEEWT